MSEPHSSTMTKLYFADSEVGEKTQIGLVQSIPEFLTVPEAITYSALDIDDERQVPGRKKAESLEIEFIFTEDQYDAVKAIEGQTKYWFIQLPEDKAAKEGKPLTWYFQGNCYIGMSEIAIDDMLKAKLTIYRNSEIKESKGFPTV